MPQMRRWPAYALAAVTLVLITEAATDVRAPAGPQGSAAALSSPIPYPPDYATALADADRALTTATERAARVGGWLAQEVLARAYIERARLTGSIEDYVAAEQALARSGAMAPPGSGPQLLQAAFDLSMHRLSQAEAKLDLLSRNATTPEAHERAEIEAMRGDIAFYRGRYDEVLGHYDQADRLSPGSTGFRRAYFHSATGDVRRGLGDIDRAERSGVRRTVQSAARAELQRGIFLLEEGEVGSARAHIMRANALFPGDWLIEEHLAEALALSGRTEAAEQHYRAIVARTEAPEFMDQLASLARLREDHEEARRWNERAWAIWRRRLDLFPEAFYAHGAENCLAGARYDCAVRLAQLNYRARPYGEAAALLAEALAAAGRNEEARRIFSMLQRSRWRSARTRRLASLMSTAS